MAVLQNPLPGSMRGSIGNVVLYDTKGQHRARSKPLTVKQPNTPQQLATQKRQSALGFLMGKMAPFVMQSYVLEAGIGNYGTNVFMQTNALNGAYDRNLTAAPWEPTPDLTLLEIGKGSLDGIIGATVTATLATGLTWTWTDNSGTGNALASDEVWYAIIPDTYESSPMSRQHKPIVKLFKNTGTLVRTAATTPAIDLTAQGYTAGDIVHVYTIAVRMTFLPYGVVQMVSDTTYVSTVTLT